MGQRVTIVEKDSGTVTGEKRFLWCASELCEERDASGGTVTKRFFGQGVQRIGGSDPGMFYYTRDHLRSVREVTDSSGTVRARYDYSVWGQPTKLEGDLSGDFGFTGHYFHEASGLNLSMYRAYSPNLGRWLSRDPIAELGGINLYGYVGNNPVNAIDPLGLAPGDWWDVRTPSHLSDQASRYAETMRGKTGNDSDHHSIAVRNFGERMEDVYGTRFTEALSPSDDWAEDMGANIKGFWDYLYENRERCEVP